MCEINEIGLIQVGVIDATNDTFTELNGVSLPQGTTAADLVTMGVLKWVSDYNGTPKLCRIHEAATPFVLKGVNQSTQYEASFTWLFPFTFKTHPDKRPS